MTTVPDAPTAVTPARSGSSTALVTFTPPENDGGTAITLYTVTADPVSGQEVQALTATGQNSPIAVNGLVNGETYSFTVRASNADGDSEPSEAATLAIGSAPSPPLSISATRESGKSSVSFNPPTSDGGAPVTHYTVKANDTTVAANGGQLVSGSSSPLLVDGLTNGDAYVFTVTATNSYGTSEEASSALVIPGGEDLTEPQAPWPNALSFKVDKRIGVLQLQDELRASVNQDCLVSLVNEDPFGADGTLWVIPDTVDAEAVRSIIDAHAFNADYETPSYLAEFNAILRKVNDDPTVELDPQEIQVALKAVLSRFPLNG